MKTERVLSLLAALACPVALATVTSENPDGYVPAMLSNGRICLTANQFGAVTRAKPKYRYGELTDGIFFEGRRMGAPRFELYGHGDYALTLKVGGRTLTAPDGWSQTLDVDTARSVVTNRFGEVRRVVETFVAADANVIAIRQTFPGTDLSRVEADVDYSFPPNERIVGAWTTNGNARTYSYVAYGRNVDRDRVTVRTAREGEAVVSFVSFGEPYAGTYAALYARHAKAWTDYYAASSLEIPDPAIRRMRRVAEYQLKCNATAWTIPVGLFPSHWNGLVFAFDEMYGVQGLLSSGHFSEAKLAAEFRKTTLGRAMARVKHGHSKRFFGYGARWVWQGMEDGNEVEGAPLGFWCDHIFHMAAIARTCWLNALYADDSAFLRDTCYPVMRECARFFRSQYVYEDRDGTAFVGKCTDLERLGPGRDHPFMTTVGVIHNFRICAEAAAKLGVDADEATDWRATADRLERALPVKDGRFIATAEDPDALSMGTLAGYFPFPVFPKGEPRQVAAVDHFLAQGVRGGNMYPTGKKICPWYAATMAMAALRAGKGERMLPLLREADKSSGVWGEYWEINEPGLVRYRPWFMTAAGNCLYAINQMFVSDGDGELRLAQGVPDGWRDYSFKLPAENGITVDLAVRDGKLSRLELHARRAVPGRKVKVVLPPSLGASPVEIEPTCP